jgi:hypothetical protein
MPRRTKATEGDRTPRKRGRRKVEQPAQPVGPGRDDLASESVGVGTPPAPAQDLALAEAEQALVAKYATVNILQGSLRPGSTEGFGTKRIVTILCASCNQPRVLATSDLHHCRHCHLCAKADKKAARRAKKESEG